ncbi:hypothetical protein BaRGS_00032065, partial [Batillaria attramentaria]
LLIHMRASVLLIVLVSTLIVSETEGWRWGRRVIRKAGSFVRRVVNKVKNIPRIPGLPHGLGKRSVDDLSQAEVAQLQAACQERIDSGAISATSDPQDFLQEVMADCNDSDQGRCYIKKRENRDAIRSVHCLKQIRVHASAVKMRASILLVLVLSAVLVGGDGR